MASRSITAALGLCFAAAGAAWPGGAGAQPLPSFDLVGPIQAFALENAADPFSAARLTVNGLEVVVPGNLRIQFPARFLRPGESFQLNPRGGGESGLALDDQAKPLAAFEAAVAGNFVGARAIAGLVSISQHQLFSLMGRVLEIHGDRNELVVGIQGGSAARVRLNDPEGKFGAPTHFDANLPARFRIDERFRADTGNPSVRAATGFPMCVPRGAADAACPAGNRPQGARNFWMGQAPANNPPDWIAPCQTCDAGQMVPFRMGDDIAVAGIIAEDAGGRYVAASSVVASLGVYTLPGAAAVRVVVEEALIGTGTTPPNLPLEGQDRLRLEGWTTDPSRTVSLYALDVAEDGTKRTRLVSAGQTPEPDPFGRVRIRLNKAPAVLRDANGQLRGAPREILLAVDGPNGARIPEGTDVATLPANAAGPPGDPGRYVAPISEFIFAEPTRPGDQPTPHDFACLSFLLRDASPFEDGQTRPGPLAPWPGAGAAPNDPVCGQ